MTGTRGRVVLMAAGWILVGAVIWGVGIFGIARGLEDRCLLAADERGYGASTQTSSLWPPQFSLNPPTLFGEGLPACVRGGGLG